MNFFDNLSDYTKYGMMHCAGAIASVLLVFFAVCYPIFALTVMWTGIIIYLCTKLMRKERKK